MSWSAIQSFMSSRGVGGWLVYDFRGSNPVFARLLPAPPGVKRHVTRRAALFVPAAGRPVLLAHELDAAQYAGAGVDLEKYISWPQFRGWLERHVAPAARVAMEYSAGASLPVVSIVDAGTVELVRALGVEVVSSADLIQVAVARWSAGARREHGRASELVDGIKDRAFAYIGERLRAGAVHEHEAAEFIRAEFTRAGLEFADGPIVGANAHAADPHYEPSAGRPAPIRRGDWVLIDLWARVPGDENIYSDITWVGYAGRDVPRRQREVFEVVAKARDASLELARESFRAGRPVQGWQLDDAARSVIIGAGFEKGIKHRTGHSLSPGPLVHGSGMNLDNLETHDTREMLPGTGFTIEPGVYLPEANFGVRSEINVYVDEREGPVVTSGVQREVVVIG